MTMTIPVNVKAQRVGGQARVETIELNLEQDLARARRLAKLLDSEFEFAGIRFGLDAIVGLIPVVGDVATAIAGMFPLWVARRHRLGKLLEMRMAANLLMDVAAGAVPLVGDVIDVAFKANMKNLRLLEAAVEKRRKAERPAQPA